jgi:tRNA threonylcarbamoyl adenosine modification protein YeaZ
MAILAFDTCFSRCSVAVEAGGRIFEASEAMERGHAERLVAMIGEVMAAASVAFDRLERIVVTPGPGTFTGVRIGVAAARALALATGAPLVAIDSLTLIAAGAARCRPEWPAGPECDLAIAMQAGLGRVFFRLCDARGRVIVETCLAGLAAAVGTLSARPVAVIGSAAEELALCAREAGRRVAHVVPRLDPEAADLAALARGVPPFAGPLEPLYLREPDARPQAGTAPDTGGRR